LSNEGGLSGQQPLTGLTWFEARAVARFYDARLPFEVEWEIAMSNWPRRRGDKKDSLRQKSDRSRFGCLVCCGLLQEWTADAFSARYWRSDFDRVGVPWTPKAAEHLVAVRGSSASDMFHHISFRVGQDPAKSNESRAFRRVWDRRPASDVTEPHWRLAEQI
jgi:formylglycine-generating enzyme required for sulfatase activity